MANSEYEKLIAESIAEMDAPPMTAAERAHMERWFAYLDASYEKEHPTPCRRIRTAFEQADATTAW
jgi:hypothetical protein